MAATATKAVEAPAAPKRTNNFHTETVRVRWHNDVTTRFALIPSIVQWAEKNGHLVQVSEGVRGTSIRVGGTLRPGAGLMSKETRERIRAAGLSKDDLDKVITDALAARAAAATSAA